MTPVYQYRVNEVEFDRVNWLLNYPKSNSIEHAFDALEGCVIARNMLQRIAPKLQTIP